MNPFKRRQSPTPARRRQERQNADELEGAGTFRRGRTLTGSMSSQVRTLSESKADLKSARVHTHELTRKRRRVTGALVLVSLIAMGFYVLVHQFTATPVVRATPDSSLKVEPVYAEAINAYLSNHIKQRLRLFTDEEQLANYLQTETPEVESVKVRGSAGFGKSLFEVEFREPIASWSVDNRRLYVDASGVPFSKNYFSSPSLRIVDKSGATSSMEGQSIMSNRFMGYIGQVIGLSEKNGYIVKSIVIPEGMTRQVEVHLNEIEYPVKFSSDRPAGEGVSDMVRAIRWMQSRQLSPEYIDVRVSGKVFYK